MKIFVNEDYSIIMNCFCLVLFISCFYFVKPQTLVTDAKINVKELRCLVCQKSIDELNEEIKKIDPNKRVDIGGHRLDADGNYRHKSVPQAKSELHLSDVIEAVCIKLDNYVRAIWKSNGTLTLFSMVTKGGKMNPFFDDVNIVQDDDLNKSLRYYCEGIMEEYEENIIKLYQDDEVDIKQKFCFKQTNICSPTKAVSEEL